MTIAMAGDVPSESGCSTVSFCGASSAMAGAASETVRTAGRARRARSFFMEHFLRKRPGQVRREAATGRARGPLCVEQNERENCRELGAHTKSPDREAEEESSDPLTACFCTNRGAGMAVTVRRGRRQGSRTY